MQLLCISKLKQVVTAARTSKIDAILQRHAGKGAILGQATRWGSTYMIVKRLLKLKPFLEDIDNPNVSLTESQWREASQLEALLSHPYAVTKKLQEEDLTLSTFLWEWKKLIFNLSKAEGLIAEGIVSSMKKREGLLLENEILLAAVYIDPMNRILLSEDQIAKAKETLCDVAVWIKGLLPEKSNYYT